MLENIPHWITWLFILTTVVTIAVFHFANGQPKKLTLFILAWSLGHSILALNGFYEETDAMPPRFLFVLAPLLLIMTFGLTKKNLQWITANRKMEISTFLHSIRIPVEIVLLYLFIHKTLPELMTFEGRNFDIFAGITAPLVGYLWYKKLVGRPILLYWNVFGLILILFVFANGILSSKLPIQLFAFDQPTIAPNYFPFILLPATIVPIVIYTHITDIVKIYRERTAGNRR